MEDCGCPRFVSGLESIFPTCERFYSNSWTDFLAEALGKWVIRMHDSAIHGFTAVTVAWQYRTVKQRHMYCFSNLLLIFWSSENIADSPCTLIWLTVEKYSFSLMCLSRLASYLPCFQYFFPSFLSQTWAKELESWKLICSPDWAQRAETE